MANFDTQSTFNFQNMVKLEYTPTEDDIIRKIEPPQGLEILTYKRNRGVSIIKLDDDFISVQERGYEENEYPVKVLC